ncbi:MAG: hypothetical protein R3D66_04975 [Alphaproteobacteria bacterium]
MALTWAQMFGMAYVIVFDTERAGIVMNAMGSLSAVTGRRAVRAWDLRL